MFFLASTYLRGFPWISRWFGLILRTAETCGLCSKSRAGSSRAQDDSGILGDIINLFDEDRSYVAADVNLSPRRLSLNMSPVRVQVVVFPEPPVTAITGERQRSRKSPISHVMTAPFSRQGLFRGGFSSSRGKEHPLERSEGPRGNLFPDST